MMITEHHFDRYECQAFTYSEKSFLKHQQRSREANDEDRLGSEQTEDDAHETGGYHELWHTHHPLRFVSFG